MFQPEVPGHRRTTNQKGPVSGTADCLGTAEDEAGGGDAGAGGDEDVVGVGDLVDRGATDLADRLGDAVHAVDVGLAELAAVGVEGEPATDLDGPVGDEPGG